MSKKLLLIVNGGAGKKRIKNKLFDVIDFFSSKEYDVTVITTQYRNHACDIAQQNAAYYDLIVCCGGDGTLSETISGIVRSGFKPSLGYIPTGSTNDMAYTLKLPANDIDECCDIIVNGEPKDHDIGLFGSDRFFSYVASFGTFADVSYNTPQTMKNMFGHLAYVLNGVKSITNIKSYNVTVKYDDQVINGDYILGAVSNSTSMGGIIRMNKPVIDLNDGLFEVILVKKPKSMIELPDMLAKLMKQDFENEHFVMFSASKVVFEVEEQMNWSLDGEHCEGDKSITVENIKSAVKIIY